MVCSGASLHADQARLQRAKIGDHLAAPQLAPDNGLAAFVDTVDLEPVLGQIEADCGNVHGGRLPSCVAFSNDTLRHSDAGSGGRPHHQE
jgi:hypothetical protein